MYKETLGAGVKVPKSLGFFRYRDLGDGKYVLTNDLGDYILVSESDFRDLTEGKLTNENRHYERLKAMGIVEPEEFGDMANTLRLRNRNLFLFRGTVLHIVVTTLRCNLKCSYCQASARKCGERDFDMSEDTAKKVVDTAFQSPSYNINFEFQGGEPLLNWPVIEFIIGYAGKKALAQDKNVSFSLVSNLVGITDEQLQFLVDNEVGLTTSIDGPAELHDLHRGRGSHDKTVANLKKAVDVFKSRYVLRLPGALMTMTKDSLPYAKQIVDEYVELGQEAVQFRKVNPFGFAMNELEKYDFSDAEFLAFYEEAFDYIIELNKKGKRFTERTAYLLLQKMLTDTPVNHMDLRNPCGAGIGQVAYHYDGGVYTCDEGRMMAMMGNEGFRMGSVHENTFKQMVESDVVKAICVASCLESLPGCDSCAYKPYCGVCPIYNESLEGSIFSRVPCNNRCAVQKGIIDIVLKKSEDPGVLDIYRSWVEEVVIL